MKTTTKFLAATIIVFAAGLATGLLIAPEKGEKTRKNIGKKGKKFWKSAKGTAEGFVDKSSELTDKMIKAGKSVMS